MSIMSSVKISNADTHTSINGILEIYSLLGEKKFRLLTSDGVINLEVPLSLVSVLKKHQWERFNVIGTQISASEFKVKKIFMEKEDAPRLFDFTKKFDLGKYRDCLKKGFYLSPQF